jgi:hypothetical protein
MDYVVFGKKRRLSQTDCVNHDQSIISGDKSMKKTIKKGSKIIKVTIVVAAFMMTILSGFTLGQTSDKNAQAKNEVIALANEYARALVKQDSAAIERILAEDYGDVSTTGLLTTKSLMLRSFKELPAEVPRPESVKLENTVVRLYGNTAVMVTTINLKWQGSKEELAKKWESLMPMRDAYMVTLVAVRKDKTWQIVATQESELSTRISSTNP